MADGNHQIYAHDYSEKSAPVVSFNLVRMALFLMLGLQIFVAQVGIKTAFLHEELEKDVCVMSQRNIPALQSRCYKLLKAIYGLKQAHLAWHAKSSTDIKDIGSEEPPSATCVFWRKSEGTTYEYILVYPDNLLIFTSSAETRSQILKELKIQYDIRVETRDRMCLSADVLWNTGCNG